MSAAPVLEDITPHNQFHITHSIYPKVIKAFYKDKLKGDEKCEEAFLHDEWRYTLLPDLIRQNEPEQAAFEKADLEQLVKWKITHQTNRPFLLPQIRKNDEKTIWDCTLKARSLLLASSKSPYMLRHRPSRDDLRKALDKVCELTGVGPATGTLILSVYNGFHIPFFEDELYHWLFPQSNTKLKYSVKEYLEIWDKLQEVYDAQYKNDKYAMFDAKHFEQIAFVCEHWNFVPEEDQALIHKELKEGRPLCGEAVHQEVNLVEEKPPTTENKITPTSSETASRATRVKRKADEGKVTTRTSSRIKKQKK